MPERIILIGADKPGLDAVQRYRQERPEASAVVLYPESNPLPEFSCMTLDRFMGDGVDFPENLRACGVDVDARRVHVRDNITGVESDLDYDALVFASSSAPAPLEAPGEFLGSIFRLCDYDDAARLTAKDGANVVIGSGMNLLLAVSALLEDGKGEIFVLPHGQTASSAPLSDGLYAMVRHHLVGLGVTFLDDERLVAIEGEHVARRVVTDKRVIDAVRIVHATPNAPVSALAADAGLRLDADGAVVVDEKLRTDKEGVYACGGCASFASGFCERPIPGVAIRATEARQAAALAESLGGGSPEFRAPATAYAVPLGDLTVSGAGLTMAQAGECGFAPMSATVIQFDRAHFMPEAELMTLELVFDVTGRVHGVQGLGKSGDALCGRISAVSAALGDKPTVEDVANLEIAYSPPFASAMDVLNTVGNVAENILAGTNEGVGPEEFERLWAERESGECFFLDCRELGNAEPYLEKHPLYWNHISQAEIARRLDEVPEDKKIILLCNTGARSYEAQIVLKDAGFEDVVNVDGGVAAIKQSGVEV